MKRINIILVLFLVILGTLIFLFLMYQKKRHIENNTSEYIEKHYVKSAASISKECSDKEKPLLLVIRNDSRHLIYSYHVNFSVYEEGYSDNKSEYNETRSTYILKPNTTTFFCVKLPELKGSFDPKTLIFTPRFVIDSMDWQQ